MVLSTICQFFCFGILGNKMSVEDYGQFNSMIALASTAAVFINNILAGIVANREIAVAPNLSRVLLKKFFIVRFLAFIIGSVVLVLYIGVTKRSSEMLLVGVIAFLFSDVFWELFEQIAFGLKITKYSMILNISSSWLWLIVILLIPAQVMTVFVVLLLHGVILALKAFIYGIVDVKITAEYKDEMDTVSYKYLALNSMPYLYNRIFGIVSVQLPIILLDGYAGLSETAYYAVGEKFTTPISKLTLVVISAVFPFLTAALKNNRTIAKKTIVSLFQIIISFGACFSLLLCATSDIWLVALFGQKYISAIEAFNYQIWYVIVISVDSLFSMLLSSDFKQKTLSVITTIDALSLIPFLYFGISYGAKGLAMAKLIHSIACLLYHLFIISRGYDSSVINVRLLISWVVFVSLVCVSIFVKSRFVLLFTTFVAMIGITTLNIPTIKNVVALIRKKGKEA